ncbi:apoptosis-inducing factor 1, mitochondrial isoform X1 [Astyanax mexicanus]|uniref:Apoptosis-inducing factor 1, mitochondrial isoform X1 n=1 Tax=Astyanax mexicanus TaxID=7994 RepID=A0A8T2L7C9_ASTMX|nr:apoptosis-inducing factor 1, mitochondrial isoform X1 [Astyanax mexicanus]
MDRRRTFSVHPREAESGAPDASPTHTSPLWCQEAPVADLPTTTTTCLETSQQDATGVPSPPTNTWGRFRKCLTNIFSSMVSCFRSRDRVVVLVGEADTLH